MVRTGDARGLPCPGVNEKIVAGKVSNMYTIAETMSGAGNVVSL